jgi:uncharacterized protein YbjT (DUF2867 family)
MSAPRILLAGATGTIGSALLPLLREGGYRIRTLSQSTERARSLPAAADEVVVADATERAALVGVTSGVDVVVSCLGASLNIEMRERRTFSAVDTVANSHLLSLAVASNVRRFVYVAAHVEPSYADSRYIAAHEAFVKKLRVSGMPATVVRPTGLFTAFRALLPMAAQGRMVVIGDGLSRTNPIHPADVAKACFGVLKDGPPDLSVGGPDVLTRAEIARAAFSAVRVPAKLTHVAPWLFRSSARAVRLANPRLGDVLDFASRVAVVDAIAPKVGTRRLDDYLRQEWAAWERSENDASLGAARGA